MLCLTAKEGSYLMIGDDIKIIILKVGPAGQTHIGISAPASLAIRRDKVFEEELKTYANDTNRSLEEAAKAMETLQKNKKERAQSVKAMYKRIAKHERDEKKHNERKQQTESKVMDN